eukprot:PhM_4_TR11636/c8_g2_i1/m.6207
MSPHQFGFTQGKSVSDAINVANETIARALDRSSWGRSRNRDHEFRHRAAAVMVDFSNAFDRVDHSLLLSKLRRAGVEVHLLRWIRNFLVGRLNQVRVNDALSRWMRYTCGVPQGTILGPQLFNIYVNDLLDELARTPCTPVMYADDLTIIYGGYPFEDIQHYIQEAVDVVVRWAAAHNMLISPKTEGLLFSNNLNIPLRIDIRCGELIIPLQLHSEHSPVRLLGVMFDSKLTFRHHADAIVRDVRRRL